MKRRSHNYRRTSRSLVKIADFPDIYSRRPVPSEKPHCSECSSTIRLEEIDGVLLCSGCRRAKPELSHGTTSRYLEGCRCAACSDANKQAWARSILKRPDHYGPTQVARAEQILAEAS